MSTLELYSVPRVCAWFMRKQEQSEKKWERESQRGLHLIFGLVFLYALNIGFDREATEKKAKAFKHFHIFIFIFIVNLAFFSSSSFYSLFLVGHLLFRCRVRGQRSWMINGNESNSAPAFRIIISGAWIFLNFISKLNCCYSSVSHSMSLHCIRLWECSEPKKHLICLAIVERLVRVLLSHEQANSCCAKIEYIQHTHTHIT